MTLSRYLTDLPSWNNALGLSDAWVDLALFLLLLAFSDCCWVFVHYPIVCYSVDEKGHVGPIPGGRQFAMIEYLCTYNCLL